MMGAKRQSTAYGRDLAYVHDVGYGGFAHGCAEGLLKILGAAGIQDGCVVDLGCGSGIWAGHLHQAGYSPLGVDISPAMVDLARRRFPEAEFQVASFLRCKLPRCRAVTALGEVLCYQFDGANSFRALSRLFRRVHKALEPGGLLIFDVPEAGLDWDRPPTGRQGTDWACLARFEFDKKRDQLVRHITTFRQAGELYRRHEETHRVQLYRRAQIAQALRSAGYRVRTVRRFGSFPLLPGRVGFVARKP